MNRRRNILTHFIAQREIGRSRHAACVFDSRLCEKLLEDRAISLRKRQPCELSGQCRSTFLMVFSPDRTKIASTHGDHTVRVTDIRTGKCSHVLSGHPRTPWCIAFHPTFEDLLATGCLAGEVRIWDLRGGCSEVWRSTDCLPISSLTFHPLDHLLVVAIGHRLYFWDWNESEPFTERETCHGDQRIRWVKFDALGQYLYTAVARNVIEGSRQYSTVSEPTVQHAPWPRPYRDVVSDMSAGLNLPRQNALDIEDSQLSDYLSGSQQSNDVDSDDVVRPWAARLRSYDDEPLAARARRDYLGRMRTSGRPEDDDADSGGAFYRGSAVRRMINLSAARVSASAISDLDSDTEAEDSSRPEYWENMRAHALRYRRYHHTPPVGRSVLNRVTASPSQSRLSSELQQQQSAASRLFMPPAESLLQRSQVRTLLLDRRYSSLASDARRYVDDGSRDYLYADAMHPIRRLSTADLLRESEAAANRSSLQDRSSIGAVSSRLEEGLTTSAVRESDSSAARDGGAAEQFTELRSSPAPSSDTSRAPMSISDYGRQSLASLINRRRIDMDLVQPRLHPRQGAFGVPSSNANATAQQQLSFNTSTDAAAQQPCPQLNTNSQAGVTCVGNGPRCVICQNYCNPPPAESSSSSSVSTPRPLLPFHRRPFAAGNGSRSLFPSASSDNNVTGSGGSSQRNSAFRDFTSSVLAAVTTSAAMPSNAGGASISSEQQQRGASAGLAADASDVMWSSQNSVPAGSGQGNGELFNPPTLMDSFGLNFADLGFDSGQEESTAAVDGRAASIASYLRGDSQDTDDPDDVVLPRLWRSSEDDDRMADGGAWGRDLQASSASSDPASADLWHSLSAAEPSASREIPYRWTRDRPFDRGSPPRRLASEDEGEYRRRVEMLENIERRIEMLQAMRMRMQGLRTLQTRIQSVSAQEGRLRTLRSIQDRLQAMRTLRERTQTLTALQGRIERLRDNLHNSRRQMMREGHRLLPADPDFHDAASLDDAAGYVRVPINRTFEGAFTSSTEVASSAGNGSQIFRIQRWDFSHGDIPDISSSAANVVVDRCKVHNDATCDLSQDGRLLAVLQPRDTASFPAEMQLSVYSLMPDTLGQRLATKSFGANAVSVSLSPLGRYLVVGMASRRRSWMVMTKQIFGQVYRLQRQNGNSGKMELQHMCDLSHPVDLDPRSHVSVNSIRWLPVSGAGIVYGTSRGDMVICTPSFDEAKAAAAQLGGGEMDTHRVRRNLVQLLTRGTVESASTQTTANGRRLSTAGTQTDSADADLSLA